MPRSFDGGVTAALASGRVIDRTLFLLDLASDLYGFWTGLGPFTYNGTTYVGAGSLISVEGIKQTSDLSAVQVVGRLTAIANSDLTPDVLATIEGEVYHQRQCLISTAYFDADTHLLIAVEVEYRGYIDRIVHTESAEGEAALEVHLESRFRDHHKTGYRIRSDKDQRDIDPLDDSLIHVSTVANEKVLFGRAAEPIAQQTYTPQKKPKSWLQRIFG